MSDIDTNIDYYEMLDLDARALAQRGVAGLKEVISEKRKEWTSQAVNPLYQQAARANLVYALRDPIGANLDRIRKFEKMLDQQPALQEYTKQISQLQKVKRQRHEREIGQLLRAAIGTSKQLNPRQRELLIKHAANEKIPESVIDEVIAKLGVQIRKDQRLAVGPPMLPYKTPAMDPTVLSQLNNWLRVLDVRSFYELLDLPAKTTASTIQSTARLLHGKWSKVLPKNSECVAWEKSLQSCVTYVKDAKAKAKYDNALFNERIDRFAQRIDLVLAGGQTTRETQVELTCVGVREFGLTSEQVNQCVQARAVAAGVTIDKPVAISVQMQGQVNCGRCYAWNPSKNGRCWNCAGSLVRRCQNPSCRKRLPSAAKRCDRCALPAAMGSHYAELLTIADTALSRGDFASALDACRAARRILPSQIINAKMRRAGKIRALIETAKRQFALRALSAAHESVTHLVQLASDWNRSASRNRVNGRFGVGTNGSNGSTNNGNAIHVTQWVLQGPDRLPTPEQLSERMTRLRTHLETADANADPPAAADRCGEVLTQWSDCSYAYQKLRRLCETLAKDGELRLSMKHARQLLTIHPGDAVLKKWVVRLQTKLNELDVDAHEQWQNRRKESMSRRALAPVAQSHEPGLAPIG